MADFIAVIRRAVDGLSDNTPEMRAKVYERARSAVVRQLENMKPRPPEAMFQKQLDKLDAAIREVEAENAEALPAEAAAEPPAETPVHHEPEPVAPEAPRIEDAPAASVPQQPVERVDERPEPVAAHAEPEPEQEQEPLLPTEPVAYHAEPVAPLVEPVQEQIEPEARAAEQPTEEELPADEPQAESASSPDAFVEETQAETFVPDYVTSEEPAARMEAEAHPSQIDVEPYEETPEIAEETQPAEAVVVPETVYQPFPAEEVEPVDEYRPVVAQDGFPESAVDPLLQHAAVPVRDEIVEPASSWAPVIDDQPETMEAALLDREPAAVMPKVSYDESDVVAGFNDFLKQEMNRKVVPPPPARKAGAADDFSWDAPFDDLPEVPKPVSFEKALEAKQKEISDEATGRTRQKNQRASARAELEDLIGVEPEQRRSPASAEDEVSLPPDVSRAVSKLEGKSFKVQGGRNKKKNKARSGFPILPAALGIVGLLVVGGGAYALWNYRDDVSRLLASVLPAETPADAVSTDAKPEADPAKAETDATPADAAQPPKETEVASLETASGPQKFTQRLMPNGSETDTDTAKVPVDQALPEGKTVAGQTEAGKDVAAATPDATKTETTDTSKPADTAQPLAATQKMFLYEERLGQSSPVAVPGTVIWQERPETEDGKPAPQIEARIELPQKKITALLTFKRNSDSSLPASHIIEIVFALPKDFEEGNIESIQRVAFKQTEQDRGNPLIAVPAKITDDFHMVALNDDPDARKVNIELMKTRSWIDIPITYRNGRRALITLEKGATGTAIFDKVMSEWDALGQQSNNQ